VKVRVASAVAGVCVCVTAVSGWAGTGEDVKALLRRPLTPGSVALLVRHLDDAEVRERCVVALADPRPEVRAVAARVVGAAGSTVLLPKLREALGGEADRGAAIEELRAVVVLGRAEDDAATLAAARRLGGGLPAMLVQSLARVDVDRALDVYRKAGVDLLSPAAFGSVFRAAAEKRSEALAPLAAAVVEAKDARAWEAALAVAIDANLALPAAATLSALRSDELEIAGATAWHLIRQGEAGTAATPQDIRAALAARPPVTAAAATGHRTDSEALFALELLRRLTGADPVEDAAWIAARQNARGMSHVEGIILSVSLPPEQRRRVLDHLTDAERAALRLPPSAKELPFRERKVEPRLGTMSGYPRGLLPSLVEEAHCKVKGAVFAAGDVRYRPDGRPEAVSPVEVAGPSECGLVAETLLPLSLESDRVPHSSAQKSLMLALRDDLRDCWDDDPPIPPPAHVGDSLLESAVGTAGATEGGRIKEPKKIVDVRPIYPESAKKQRHQGVVVLEATIGRTGCVNAIDVLRGVGPDLNSAALRAVSGWRYTPTLLNGAPVPVVMSVTVNFRLSP
jgi:TonB family protein